MTSILAGHHCYTSISSQLVEVVPGCQDVLDILQAREKTPGRLCLAILDFKGELHPALVQP